MKNDTDGKPQINGHWVFVVEATLTVYPITCTFYLLIAPLIADIFNLSTVDQEIALFASIVATITLILVGGQIYLAIRQVEVTREIAAKQNQLIQEQTKIAKDELKLVERQMAILERHERANLSLSFGRENADREGSMNHLVMGLNSADPFALALVVFNTGNTITSASIELYFPTPNRRDLSGIVTFIADENWKGNYSTYTRNLDDFDRDCLRCYHQSPQTFYEDQPVDLPSLFVRLPKIGEPTERFTIYWTIRSADGTFPAKGACGVLTVSVGHMV